MENLLLMHKDDVIAKIINGNIEPMEEKRLPYTLSRTRNIETWLKSRAIDGHRANSRLLKRILRLIDKDDISTVLSVNAATITDNYWVKPEADTATSHESILFKENYFDNLSLYGEPDSYSLRPSRTPELTNIGSYEKCWRLHDGEWWMYKAGDNNELFSELLIYKLGSMLGFNMAEYSESGKYIKTKDFTGSASVDFDPAYGIIGENTEYNYVYDKLLEISPKIAEDYIRMCYLDAVFYNMDRHEYNFGILRDAATGDAISLAPLFDHNIALIARAVPTSLSDILISDFAELIHRSKKKLVLNELEHQAIMAKIKEVPFAPDHSTEAPAIEEYVAEYIIKRQEAIASQCKGLLTLRPIGENPKGIKGLTNTAENKKNNEPLIGDQRKSRLEQIKGMNSRIGAKKPQGKEKASKKGQCI